MVGKVGKWSLYLQDEQIRGMDEEAEERRFVGRCLFRILVLSRVRRRGAMAEGGYLRDVGA
jgi:hypothetical protein